MMSRLTQMLRNSVKTTIKRKESKKIKNKLQENEKVSLTPRSDRAKVLRGSLYFKRKLVKYQSNLNVEFALIKEV